MKTMIHHFIHDERGATAIEYGLIAALIFLAIVGAVRSVGQEVLGVWTDNAETIQQATDEAASGG
jgi:pilus assembly protein Flp/PilA